MLKNYTRPHPFCTVKLSSMHKPAESVSIIVEKIKRIEKRFLDCISHDLKIIIYAHNELQGAETPSSNFPGYRPSSARRLYWISPSKIIFDSIFVGAAVGRDFPVFSAEEVLAFCSCRKYHVM
jgi:hypothetical protein